jgi:hypothetical protein
VTTATLNVVVIGTLETFNTTVRANFTADCGAAINGTCTIKNVEATTTSKKFTAAANALRVTIEATAPKAQFANAAGIVARLQEYSRAHNGIGGLSVSSVSAQNASPSAAVSRCLPTVVMALVVAVGTMMMGLLF